MPNKNENVAFVMNFYNSNIENWASPNEKRNKKLCFKEKMHRREAFSPQPFDTYFWVNEKDFKNNSINKVVEGINLKKIDVFIKKNTNKYHDKSLCTLKERVISWSKNPTIKQKVLMSMIK